MGLSGGVGFINTNNLPPEGYFIYAPETNWTSPKYIGLDSAIMEVQRHRIANPRFNWPTDSNSIREFILQYTEARLRQMPGGEQWLVGPPESPPPGFPLPQRQRQARAAPVPVVVDKPVKKVLAGIGLITEWLGSELTPVGQELADHRASICARCVLNQKPTEPVTSVVADGLHLLMEAKAHIKLSTPHDLLLETCTACFCRNSLKVWTPIEHVKAHTTPGIFAALAVPCWIRNELAGPG